MIKKKIVHDSWAKKLGNLQRCSLSHTQDPRMMNFWVESTNHPVDLSSCKQQYEWCKAKILYQERKTLFQAVDSLNT